MALSPEEVLQNNLNPLLSGIGQYGQRLANDQKTQQDRAYAQRLLEDSRRYEESRHEQYRSEGKTDVQEVADKTYRRTLEEHANKYGIDPAGKDNLRLASLVDHAEHEHQLEDKADEQRQSGKIGVETTKLQADQAIRNHAQALGLKGWDTADITDLQDRIPEAETKKSIADENTRNTALDKEAANPDNQKVVQEYDEKAKELARQAAGFYSNHLSQGTGDLSPEEAAKATKEAFANVADDPIFSKQFKAIFAASKKDPNIAAAIERFKAGVPTQQDRKLVFSDPTTSMAMITEYGSAEDRINKLHALEGRATQYTARQQDSERIRYLAEDLKALQKKHSFLAGRAMYNSDGLYDNVKKPNLGGGTGSSGAAPGLPPSTFQPQTLNATNSVPSLPQSPSLNQSVSPVAAPPLPDSGYSNTPAGQIQGALGGAWDWLDKHLSDRQAINNMREAFAARKAQANQQQSAPSVLQPQPTNNFYDLVNQALPGTFQPQAQSPSILTQPTNTPPVSGNGDQGESVNSLMDWLSKNGPKF